VKIAFYAPLKPPDHPVPSGDREIARGLLQALRLAGHDVALASRLRSFDARGDSSRQARLARIGSRIADRLVDQWRRADRPDLWFTYHLHHKAPDLVGPVVCRELDMPYVVTEASIAPRQRAGPWADGYARAVAAISGADSVVFLNPADVAEVRKARLPGAASAMLAPFIDAARWTCSPPPRLSATAPRAPVRVITVAMMREGAKLASYRALAGALARLREYDWALAIVGDGPARDQVAAAFAALAGRVSFLGARTSRDVAALLAASDIFAWPAIDEAIGIVFLEAQACGLPVVGARTPGVAAVVADACTGLLPPPGDVACFADALRRLLLDKTLRLRMGAQGIAHVRARHDIPVAAARLDEILQDVVARHRPVGANALPC
jgi:glycosyltransferase involved in cell wall biosynthesis